MIINCNDISLRDTIEDDIENYFYWYNVDKEWMEWDAPWENNFDLSAEEIKNKVSNYISLSKKIPRVRFEVDYKNKHVGWVSSYYIDKEKKQLAVGIDIAQSSFIGMGIGTQAFKCFIKYIFDNYDLDEIFFQTWSGNKRMIRVGEKCGFILYEKKISIREIKNKKYDGLLFILKKNHFNYNE